MRRRLSPNRPVFRAMPDAVDTALVLLKGLNVLLAQAERDALTPAIHILTAARDELAGWAADRPCQYIPSKTPACRRAGAGGLFPAARTIARSDASKSSRTRRAIADLFNLLT